MLWFVVSMQAVGTPSPIHGARGFGLHLEKYYCIVPLW